MKQESDHKGSGKMFVKEFGLYPKAIENYWVLSRKNDHIKICLLANNMAMVKNKLEMLWEAGRTSGYCCRCLGLQVMVEWSRMVVIGLQKKRKKKIRKVEQTGLGLVTGQIGEKGGREKSNIIPRFLNLELRE